MQSEIIRLLPAQFDQIRQLLTDAGLPSADLLESEVELFGILEKGQLFAVGGYEYFTGCGFLRSIAVRPDKQNQGYAGAITSHLELMLRNKGARNLYLLTFSAERFFEKRGWRIINRDEMPDEIKNTAEFSRLCPESATAMCKYL